MYSKGEDMPPLTDYLTYSYCSLPDQPNRTDLQHQQIKTSDIANNFYNCLNRLDEKPFSKGRTLNNMSTSSIHEKWLNNVNTPCEDGLEFRRCLGDGSDICVMAMSK